METEMKSETTVSASFVSHRAADSVNSVLSGEFSGSAASEFSTYLSCELFSNGFDLSSGSLGRSRESSVNLREYVRGRESLDISEELNRPDWESNQSYFSMDYPISRDWSPQTVNFSNRMDNDDDSLQFNGDVGRGSAVVFRDIASESDDEDDFGEAISQEEPRVTQRAKKGLETRGKRGKRGSCHRCLKGSRFTEKEACIVCDAKYCSNCVLRAMGSMPEGRKCVSCIGYPIDETKRGSLGTSSRMLKRKLTRSEVKQIMKTEKLCVVNQLPAGCVCVNGKALCRRELVTLQTCPNPPRKLKRGNYWYDEVTGLWGKEGQKPSEVISPHLNVGGPIKPDASKGNTQVFINGREITSVELRMLQLAGVQCAGNERFWVAADGSYQEEGTDIIKGCIWDKAGMKLVCAVLSLPIPSKFSNIGRSVSGYIDYQITLRKLLLVGCSGSGTSTIFKQAKILYTDVPFWVDERESIFKQAKILYTDVPFWEDERESIKKKIQRKLFCYLCILLEGRQRFEEESLSERGKKQSSDETDSIENTYSADSKTLYTLSTPRLKDFSDWLVLVMVSGALEDFFPAANREYAPIVEELWKDTAIQATYVRRSELEVLPSVASYFLERVVDIMRIDYEPSDLDILYAEGIASKHGLASVNFSFPHSASYDVDTAVRYQLIRIQARDLGENCKRLEMFEDVGMVIFCVALSDYDQFALEGNGSLANKMMVGRKFIESIVSHPTFAEMEFLLILSKFDLFEQKIERVPLNQCDWFDDFRPLISGVQTNSNLNRNNINHSSSLAQVASHYIAVKFKRFYSSLTGRKLYVSVVNGMEADSVDAALRYAREILKWDEEKTDFSLSDYSFFSSEGSSFCD
ncbi:Extra-large guanine nucleotide-binding protein like [Melia azedarach]|uniref:Extra-large guanine nucleotide-binding protein like n=1 Tax=Melia azedarach TaxID=155640 RepID=A0ACC1XSJ3_MELAZ|nr:Extra-large guanine nucleotide-binding protein like [Melia azedarach]